MYASCRYPGVDYSTARQLGDAAGVYAVQSDTLDAGYLRHWAASLGVQHDLEGLVTGKIRPKTT